MSQILGLDPEAGKAIERFQHECPIILLEEVRMRDLQINVPIHFQDWPSYLQDY